MRQDFDPPAGSRHSLCRAQASAHDPQAVEKLLKDLGDTPMSLVILFVSPDTDFAAFVSRWQGAHSGDEPQTSPQRPPRFGDLAEVENVGAGLAGNGADAKGIGGDDLVRPGRAAGRQEFVAGCNQRDKRAPDNRNGGMIGGSRERQCRGIEKTPLREKGRALGEIHADGAYVPATRHALEHLDGVGARCADIFLDGDGVGAGVDECGLPV